MFDYRTGSCQTPDVDSIQLRLPPSCPNGQLRQERPDRLADWGSDRQHFKEDLLKLSRSLDVGTSFFQESQGPDYALAASRIGKLSSNFQMEITYDIKKSILQYGCFCRVTGLNESMRGCICSHSNGWNTETTSMKANSWIDLQR